MRSYYITCHLSDIATISHISSLLDKDFDPFDSDVLDVDTSDDKDNIYLHTSMSNGHRLEHYDDNYGDIQ